MKPENILTNLIDNIDLIVYYVKKSISVFYMNKLLYVLLCYNLDDILNLLEVYKVSFLLELKSKLFYGL